MLIINLIGLVLIFLIIWWFWLYRPNKTIVHDGDITITVKDGVYSPAVIEIPSGKLLNLRFNRADASPCSETLLIPKLEISETLKLNAVTNVQLPALTTGEYPFHCQMQMYRGVINVV